MGALAITATAANNGATATPAGVASSDTIAQAVLGAFGALLIINNASGSTDTVTVTDAGSTPAGNPLNLAPGGVISTTITTGTSKIFRIKQEQVNPSTGLITITHTQTTSVTYELYAVGPT